MPRVDLDSIPWEIIARNDLKIKTLKAIKHRRQNSCAGSEKATK
jgi:hypothetical protein